MDHLGWPGHLVLDLQAATGNAWQELPIRYAVGGMATTGETGLAATIDTALSTRADTPALVLIMMGTNDTGASGEADWKTSYRYVLNAIHTKWPTAPIHCLKSRRDGTVLVANPWIDDVVAEHPDYLFASFDLSNVITDANKATLTTDGTHPNHAGCVATASALVTALGY